jgi:gluconate:H+ symporter, GntP family
MEGTILFILLTASIAFIIATAMWLKWHPMISLISAALLVGLFAGLSPALIINEIMLGFGNMLAGIGLIVVFGSMIGLRLEQSGAIAEFGARLIKLSGKSHPGLLLALFGAVLGIPVFCDSGFLVLINLARSISAQGIASMPMLSLSLATGLYSTHTLVPPTPGPVAAAANLGMTDMLGWVMLSGVLVAVPAVIAVYFFIQVQSKNLISTLDLTKIVRSENRQLSKFQLFSALMMVVVPLLLITFSSLIKIIKVELPFSDFLTFIGNPVIALFIGYVFGLFVPLIKGKTNNTLIQDAMQQAGPILILTGSGAAFGGVIRACGINEVLASWIQNYAADGMLFLVIAFLLAALLKTAQGSSTSALVISSVILAPLASAAGIVSPWDFALLISAIGAGAMTVSHTNDSYFWVVIQLSGFDLKNGLKGMSLATLVQGISALLMVLFLYIISH